HRSDGTNVGGLRALARLAELVLDLRALREGTEAVTRDAREVDEGVLPPVVRGDEAEALLVAEPLDDTSCHTTPPHCWSDARGGAAGHCLPACSNAARGATTAGFIPDAGTRGRSARAGRGRAAARAAVHAPA